MGFAIDWPYDVNSSGADTVIVAPATLKTLPFIEVVKARFGLYQGSGGRLTVAYKAGYSGVNLIPESFSGKTEAKLSSRVDTILTAFNLTKEELASVCRVQSRKTLYNWIDGTSVPRKAAMQRIFDLFDIAQAWRQSGYPGDAEAVHNPVLAGKSVFDLLREEALDKERILFAGTRLALSLGNSPTLKDPFA